MKFLREFPFLFAKFWSKPKGSKKKYKKLDRIAAVEYITNIDRIRNRKADEGMTEWKK